MEETEKLWNDKRQIETFCCLTNHVKCKHFKKKKPKFYFCKETKLNTQVSRPDRHIQIQEKVVNF